MILVYAFAILVIRFVMGKKFVGFNRTLRRRCTHVYLLAL